MNHLIHAPFTAEQTNNIELWQSAPWVHPLTCVESLDGPLEVTAQGLICETCGYRQSWVPAAVAVYGPPPDPTIELNKRARGG